MKIYLIILFMIPNEILCSGNQTKIEKCIKHAGDLPKTIYIEGCVTPPCIVQSNRDISLEFEFLVPRPVKSLQTLATGYVTFLHITFPKSIDLREYEHACNYLTNTKCPIEANTVAHFAASIYIAYSNLIPKGINAALELRVVDEYNVALACGRIPFIIY